MDDFDRKVLRLDVQIFAEAAELGLRQLDLARELFLRARECIKMSNRAFGIAEDAARRIGPELGTARDGEIDALGWQEEITRR